MTKVSGQAILVEQSSCLPQEYRQALASIGYCPQDDRCLIDLLTFAEHHELICAMKGCTPTINQVDTLKNTTVRKVIGSLRSNEYSHCQYLQNQRHKLLRHATAAERRKLSIEIALIGDPQVSQCIKCCTLPKSFFIQTSTYS